MHVDYVSLRLRGTAEAEHVTLGVGGDVAGELDLLPAGRAEEAEDCQHVGPGELGGDRARVDRGAAYAAGQDRGLDLSGARPRSIPSVTSARS